MAKRKRHSAQFKAKVALEALKGIEPASVLAARYSVHPTMISRWKNQLLEHAQEAFSSKRDRSQQEAEALQSELYEQIGRLQMELEWLKKKVHQLG
jgi:putative transposase